MKMFIRIRKHFNLIEDLAADFSSQNMDDTVVLPTNLGSGKVKGCSFSSDLNLYVGEYILKEPLNLETINEPDKGAFCIFCSLMSNQISIKMKDRWVPLEKNSPKGLFFYSPGTSVKVRYPAGEPFKTVAITFTSDTIEGFNNNSKILEGLVFNSPFLYFDENAPEVEALVNKLSLFIDKKEYSKFELYVLLLNFVRLILTRTFIKKDHLNLSGLLKADIKRIFLTKRKIEENVHVTLKIKNLAQEVAMSESKLTKLFKQVFGITIHQYARNVKFIKAKELLSSGKYTVSEVGAKVGYSNMSHFAKAFYEFHTINPSKYLQSL